MNLHTRQSRRRFINGALATTGMLGLVTPFDRSDARGSSPIDGGALATFRAQLKGRLVLPTDAGYEAARRVYFWNPDTEKRPALVVRCAHVDDVRHAIAFARTHALEVAVRGGGHSPMGWGTSNGLVIDMAGMNLVTIDPATRTARVDAGALGGEVMRQAGRHGLAPVVGQCAGVGAAGVTLGGGLGWLSGLHGAACDNLLAARVVTADGTLLSVDAERNPDLLWGLRGAGANFGVITSFDCRLHSLGPVTAGDIHYPVREARSVLRLFREFMAEAPDAFQATLNLTPGERGVFVQLCHAGESAEAERLLRSLRAIAAPAKDMVRRQEFADLAGRQPTGTADADFRCVATAYRHELSDEVMNVVLDRLAEAPASTVIGISHYMHGELCRVASDSTAFPLRQSGGVHIRFGADWNDPGLAQRLMPWASEASRLLRASSGERIYANYQSHAGKGSAEAVYGSNHARLVALKNTYDPSNVFRRNSNVEPTSA
ncbi:6-hydroxy-D-nicotine oxidase [Luteitalea pratensis]|uniref:6-hydroxy-D-nicotine oxidase n=1 Tax=Luteitalea pratensis TaxID=1855912 RepID=A0A143PGI6_LUTPR|nr:FAD-binding oxidoreductase [Luteitalea pratensis]AMY07645.1 6-hydroxy-D-nicotine oxidase [Luteitalea pratensis]